MLDEPNNESQDQQVAGKTYDPAKDPEGKPSELEIAFLSAIAPELSQPKGVAEPLNDRKNDEKTGLGQEGGEIVVTDLHASGRTDDPVEPLESQEQRWKRTLRQWQFKYVMALRTLGAVGLACRHAGVNRTIVGNWRSKDPEFAAACQEAEADKIEAVETALLISATIGDPEPIFQTGKRVGTRRRKSDKAAEIILRAERPEKYRPDYQGAPTTQTMILASSEQVLDVVKRLRLSSEPSVKPIEGKVVESEGEKAV